MPTKTKEQLAADIIAEHSKAPKATAAQKEQARKARAGARIAKANSEAKDKGTKPTSTAKTPTNTGIIPTAKASELAGIGGVSFRAADYMSGDIWVPDSRIPSIDETTYERHKTQAEGQSRSIEVASLNLKNISGLHRLEGQSVDIAIAAKANETRYAKLEGAEIDFQTQIQANAEKSEKLSQATDNYQLSARETGYRRELIGLKDENYQLDIQQARSMFAEKSSRYQAQLSGQ